MFIKVVGIKFRNAGRIYYYNAGDLDLKVNDVVLVNAPAGQKLGTVIVPPTLVPQEKTSMYNVLEQKMDEEYFLANLSPATLDGSIDSEPKVPEQLDKVIKIATEEDIKAEQENIKIADTAHQQCDGLIRSKKLPMKLVKTELSHNAKKVVFYFTSNGRVDFRDLVKDLLRDLKMRIELRQIDLRDETKLMGGIGCCGKTLCCSTFLRQFKPVSIKMAKEQNLALNPTKVSGVCGRLLCCLAYEIDTYNDIKKDLPKIGGKVKTPDGPGKVFRVDIFSSNIDVLLDSGSLVKFPLDKITELERGASQHGTAKDLNAIMKEATPEVSEEELKALEDPKEVIDIKDTFMKPASKPDNRDRRPQHGSNPHHRDNRDHRGNRDNRDRRDHGGHNKGRSGKN